MARSVLAFRLATLILSPGSERPSCQGHWRICGLCLGAATWIHCDGIEQLQMLLLNVDEIQPRKTRPFSGVNGDGCAMRWWAVRFSQLSYQAVIRRDSGHLMLEWRRLAPCLQRCLHAHALSCMVSTRDKDTAPMLTRFQSCPQENLPVYVGISL